MIDSEQLPIIHYYHIFCDGQWLEPLNEHLSALRETNLLSKLHDFRIGLVGNEVNIEKVIMFLNESNINYSIVAQEPIGWEQVTLKNLFKDSQSSEFYALYCHTKGSGYPSPISAPWRRVMTHEVVINWEKHFLCLKEGADAVGPFWDTHGNDHNTYFAGNFWWAKSETIKNIGCVGEDNRFQAEGWLSTLNFKSKNVEFDVRSFIHMPILDTNSMNNYLKINNSKYWQ